ncbi:SDR family oxidoreductase [Vibrio sp. Of7-15]|uniref:DUF2867 domain-containing protein n=1 Tax=Vibrio sp. Of7-15 TaxID=2724879 RepID=UPI001EF27272|nr:DUF2867 domain-containing protein [Vibrio sp. Of7-15]MCG7497028.1 SDR family oxidoreductase [Vibrio sp. Of7-15]
MQRILIIGASGYVGSHLTPVLVQKGYQVTATARNIKPLQHRGWHKYKNLNLHPLDLKSPSALPQLLHQHDVVLFLVHGMAHGHDFIDYELDLAHNFRDALKKSKIKHVIYLSAIQPQKGTSAHLATRKATGDILRQSEIPITELRAGIIIGSGSAAFEVMRDFVYHLPLLIAPKGVASLSAPIALPNLIYYLLKLLDSEPERHQVFDVAGPEIISYEQQMQVLANQTGKRLRMVSLPFFPLKLSTYWLKVVTSVPHDIASALVSGIKHNLPADNQAICKRYPQRLLTFEESVDEALNHENEAIRNNLWGFDPSALTRWQTGYGYYPKQTGYKVQTTASSEQLWSTIKTLGGSHEYFYANYLWRIREWIDVLCGGNATTRRRAFPDELKTGDHIDSWKIIKVEENKFVSLLFGMKAPGLGRLEFTITDMGDKRELDVRAWWHPAGFKGLLYWFAMMPTHLFIFKGMAKSISHKAEKD